jgi:aminomethyltransferase
MKTILYDLHLALGAKIVPFASFDMPLHYGSILEEYTAVRTHAGVFDVSHMGRIECTGTEALKFLDSLSTNSLFPPHRHSAKYSILCDEEGGAIDDVIIYTISEEKAFLVANSSNRLKVLEHLQVHSKEWKVSIVPKFEDEGILSLQGRQVNALGLYFLPTLERFQFQEVLFQHTPILVSRTGYTGEDGYEFFAPNAVLKDLWELLASKAHPCGLGARDLLRLDMGYALYGHELSPSINPIESVAAFAVKLQDHEFIGKKSTEQLINSGRMRYAAGLKGTGRGIAREGYRVFEGTEEIGSITSGNFSPTLGAPIALALLKKKYESGKQLFVQIREELHPFELIKPPFITIKNNRA